MSRVRDNRSYAESGIWPWIALTMLMALTAIQLHMQGRQFWCACGQPFLWSGDIWSRHNSQHLFDPYSFTHVLHGMIFCGFLAWLCPRAPPAWRLFLATVAEALWEIAENTDYVIGRYRAATASLDYQGDSIANSLGDVLCFVLGFLLARRVGLRWSIAIFVLTEAVLLVWIRDGLLLNIQMLIYPIDAIKNWQLGQ